MQTAHKPNGSKPLDHVEIGAPELIRELEGDPPTGLAPLEHSIDQGQCLEASHPFLPITVFIHVFGTRAIVRVASDLENDLLLIWPEKVIQVAAQSIVVLEEAPVGMPHIFVCMLPGEEC